MRTMLALVAAATLVLVEDVWAQTSPAPAPAAWTAPGNEEIRRILVERIDQQHDGVGIASTERGGDDIGFHLLTGAPLAPAPKPRVQHHAIAFDPKAFDAYVGVYRFHPRRR